MLRFTLCVIIAVAPAISSDEAKPLPLIIQEEDLETTFSKQRTDATETVTITNDNKKPDLKSSKDPNASIADLGTVISENSQTTPFEKPPERSTEVITKKEIIDNVNPYPERVEKLNGEVEAGKKLSETKTDKSLESVSHGNSPDVFKVKDSVNLSNNQTSSSPEIILSKEPNLNVSRGLPQERSGIDKDEMNEELFKGLEHIPECKRNNETSKVLEENKRIPEISVKFNQTFEIHSNQGIFKYFPEVGPFKDGIDIKFWEKLSKAKSAKDIVTPSAPEPRLKANDSLVLSSECPIIYEASNAPWPRKAYTSVRNQDPYRLPPVVTPLKYRLTIRIEEDFPTSGIFTGSVYIDIRVIENTNFITLHALDLKIDPNQTEVSCDKVPYSLASISNATNKYEMITLELNGIVLAASSCTIKIDKFTGQLKNDMRGFYKSSYKNEHGATEWLATTQFEPVYARRAFPCFDEPGWKAAFELTIRHPASYRVIANTPLISTVIDVTPDRYVSIFQTTPIMSTYLNAFVISKFEYVANSVYRYRVFARKNALQNSHYALYIAPHLLNILEAHTNITYLSSNIGKLDQIAIPDFNSGAMENWGLITYREPYLLWDYSNNNYKKIITNVIAHELTHQWFGNLVTCHWWSDLWLNEGFATYYSYYTTDVILPEWQSERWFVVEQIHHALAKDVKNSSAMTSKVSTPDEIRNKFSAISYSKAASVIRMMITILGKNVYKRGIRNYLTRKSYSSATPDDLFSSLTNSSIRNVPCRRNFTKIMRGWTEQPGYPVVNITLRGSDAIITQERFYLGPRNNKTLHLTWDIPLTYTTGQNPNFKNLTIIWFPKHATNVTIKNILPGCRGWLIFNVRQIGFFRVNYDNRLWAKIQKALCSANFSDIDVINRVQIMGDAFNLAIARYISWKLFWNIYNCLCRETNYFPWRSASAALAFARKRIGKDHELAPLYQRFICKIIKKIRKTVSFDESKKDFMYNTKRSLILTLACQCRPRCCGNKSLEFLNNYSGNGISVNSNLKDIVYCYALRYSNSTSNWNFLWREYVKTNLDSEKVTILAALSCTRDKLLLYRYLNKTISKKPLIRTQNLRLVYVSVSNNPDGYDVLFKFLKDNYKILPNFYKQWNTLFLTVADKFTTEEEVKKLVEFFVQNAEDLGDAASTVKAAIKLAKRNIKWMKDTRGEWLEWFSEKYSGARALNVNVGMISIWFLVLFYV